MKDRGLARKRSKPLTVALICGGSSAERKVSLSGADEVEKALDPQRYKILRYDPSTDLERLIRDASNIDVAFILLHGPMGEDGTMQGMLELLGIPYQGSGVLGSALAMDKHLSKVVYRQAGIPTPRWMLLEKGEVISVDKIVEELGLPLMVKPRGQGSSVGMSKVKGASELLPAIDRAFGLDSQIIIEEFISGRELTGGVLGLNEPFALPLVEIIPGDEYEFFDYVAKYKPGATKEICPAPVSSEIEKIAKDLSIRAHKALDLRAYSRTDMLLSESNELYVIETNTIPGMTPTSLFPQAAKEAGIGFSELLDRLIDMALYSD